LEQERSSRIRAVTGGLEPGAHSKYRPRSLSGEADERIISCLFARCCSHHYHLLLYQHLYLVALIIIAILSSGSLALLVLPLVVG